FFDLRLTLKDISENSWRFLRRLLDFFRSESDFERFLRRLLKDSRKTLGRLIGNSSNIFYARIFPTKSS
ncbi:hypothetical protein IGI04_035140, partial [Brassica rapa subsp. trilocularis]